MPEVLDDVIRRIDDFGPYQIRVMALIMLATSMHSAVHIAYVFTAADGCYRCEIPECDSSSPAYEPSWLPNAVPYQNTGPTKCQQYFYNSSEPHNGTCSFKDFDRSMIVSCNSFVYKTEERSIVQEYDLQCDNNLWKLSMVGSVNSLGQFFGLFLGGLISDKYGRKVLLIWGMVLCAVCGIVRAFMPTYEWFLVFEFLDAAFGAGTYICGFILGVELVGPKKRVLTGILSSSCYTFGEIFTAAAAWVVQNWRHLIFILYSPIFVIISYIWLVPESVRWNLSKGRVEEAKAILRKAAKVNGKELSENTLEKLSLIELDEDKTEKDSFGKALLGSVTITMRLINCCICWSTCTFLFYGLTLTSVSIAAGNSYLDFILTSLIELPAYLCCNFMLQLFGRRWSISLSYLLTGFACAAHVFVPQDSHVGTLAIYLIGKFGATAAFTNLYVITSEMFPTKMRHSFMGTCSTFGRLGNMIAPQTHLLASIWTPLPMLSFAVTALIAAFLTLLFPETSNIKLPDTIEEAEMIGKTPLKVLPEKFNTV
ncbi:unnamed protein product [Acanthoscelides obtectus]|uniref:Major facilitator superfamily (MFS) profile domain-containing protein n=1 Tax=Acanthoscelides obtectus TaxID=200917 RepID=A0A9P0LLS4_ACAOB|nr:unnamed protein product [Acanthoscelides obtectus]CAK1679847.1 Solute carrier family 22 member 2 [Acanthoscelides obtectus]